MIKVSTTGMAVSLKTDLRFPISGQWGHGDRIIQYLLQLQYFSKYHLFIYSIAKYFLIFKHILPLYNTHVNIFDIFCVIF